MARRTEYCTIKVRKPENYDKAMQVASKGGWKLVTAWGDKPYTVFFFSRLANPKKPFKQVVRID